MYIKKEFTSKGQVRRYRATKRAGGKVKAPRVRFVPKPPLLSVESPLVYKTERAVAKVFLLRQVRWKRGIFVISSLRRAVFARREDFLFKH